MIEILITEKAGVVISAQHHACGTILPNVPPGIARALLHFKQGKQLSGPELGQPTTPVPGGGSPQEDFVVKLKALLVSEFDFEEDEAEAAIKAHSQLVIQGVFAGPMALRGTAMAVDGAVKGAPVAGAAPLATQPSARFIPQAGAQAGGAVGVVQPTAPYPGAVQVGGATAVPVAGAPAAYPGGNPNPELGAAEGKADDAAVQAAAEKPLQGGDAPDFDGMTIAQLNDYASTHEIDLTGVTRKADIIAAIQAAQKK